MKHGHLLAAAVFALVLGCGATPEKPPETAETRFDSERYLTAAGVGSSEAEARREAVAALAGIFESRVYSETSSSAASFISDSTPEAFEKNVETKVKIESEVDLQGVRIESGRQDPDSGLYSAVAALDRRQAARQWYDQMEQIDTRLAAALLALPQHTGRLTRMGALNRILEAALEKAALRSRLRVIGMPAVPEEEADLRPIAEEAAVLRAESAFFVAVQGARSEIVADRIEHELSTQGLSITRDRQRAVGAVTGRIDFTSLQLDNPEVNFVRGAVRLKVVDVDSGDQVASIAENIRKGHVDESEAVRMAAEAVSVAAAEQLLDALGLKGFTERRRQ